MARKKYNSTIDKGLLRLESRKPSEKGNGKEASSPADRFLDLLDEAVEAYHEHPPLCIGDKVVWKRGFKNINLTDASDVMVILEDSRTLPSGILQRDDVPKDSVGYNEVLDLKVGTLAVHPDPALEGRMDFITFHISSRRVKPYEV